MRKQPNGTPGEKPRVPSGQDAATGRPAFFRAGSLKSNPDYYHRDPLIALALKFYLRGLPGLDIRQTAVFVSDPNDGRIGRLERPVLRPPRVVEALASAVDRGDLPTRNRIRLRRQCERAAENNRQHCLLHRTSLLLEDDRVGAARHFKRWSCRTRGTTNSFGRSNFDPSTASDSRPIFLFLFPTWPLHDSIAVMSIGRHRRSWTTLIRASWRSRGMMTSFGPQNFASR